MAKQHKQTCPIARFLNVFGDSWTLLVLREAFYGATRFTEMQRNTGIARNLLSHRLSLLVKEGILERFDIGERGPRHAYRLTNKGQSMVPVLVAIVQWSNDHLFREDRRAVVLVERASGRPLSRLAPTSADGTELRWADIVATPGPGASKATRKRIKESPHGIEEPTEQA